MSDPLHLGHLPLEACEDFCAAEPLTRRGRRDVCVWMHVCPLAAGMRFPFRLPRYAGDRAALTLYHFSDFSSA